MSLNSSITKCLILTRTLWKRFIQINCLLIAIANLALYSNKYFKFMNEIRLFFIIFLTYSFKNFKCRSTRKNLFFFECSLTNWWELLFSISRCIHLCWSIKTCTMFLFDNWISYFHKITRWCEQKSKKRKSISSRKMTYFNNKYVLICWT